MKVRHLVEKASGGRPVFYWQPSADLRRAGWLPMRLPDDRATALARAEALNLDVDRWRQGEAVVGAPAGVVPHEKGPAAGTVAALIVSYKASRWWSALAPATRISYGRCLDVITAWAGDMPVRAITPKAVEALYQAQSTRMEGAGRNRRRVDTPAKAHAILRVLRLLLGVAERLGYIPKGSNPAAKPGISLQRQREPRLWSAAAVEHMAAVADRLGWRSIGTAIILNEWIGQREADVLALPPWEREGGAIVLRQGKTGRRVALPVYLVPHLVARLDAEAARAVVVRMPRPRGTGADAQPLMLPHDRTRRSWKRFRFSHVFAEVRAAAIAGMPADEARGLPALPPMPACEDLRFAELRHTAVTRLHEAGVDEQGIAGITGHTPGSVRAILDRHYLIRTTKAAERAFKTRLAAEDRG
jgi:hypothetical protein